MIVDLDLQFQQGDPYRSMDYQQIQEGARLVDEAWPEQHHRDGYHDEVIFEKAALHVHFPSPGAPAVLEYASGIYDWGTASNELWVDVQTTFATVRQWGFIAWAMRMSPDQRMVLYPEIIDGRKTRTKGFIRMPPNFSGRMMVLAVGRRVRP